MGSPTIIRQGTADLAKGIAVILMIQVHLTEIFAEPAFYTSWLGRISLFLGGPPVAPVFMVILGYFLGKTRRSFSGLMLRGAGLFLIGLLLNAGLNFHLLTNIFNGTIRVNPWEYLFGVDILFLAALSIIILAALRPLFRKVEFTAILTALLVVALSPLMTNLLSIPSSASYLLAYLGGNYTWSYFPLFPWLAYPILGFAFSLFQQRYGVNAPKSMVPWIGLLIAAAALATTLHYAVSVSAELPVYYHHDPLFFLWTVVFLGIWFVALSLLHKDLGETTLFRYIKWLGRNVLTVYAWQWLIIGNLGTALYKTQSLPQVMVWFSLILIAVSTLEYFRLKFVDEWKRRGHAA